MTNTSIVNELLTFDADRYNISELIELHARAEAVRKTYTQFNVTEPDEFGDGLRRVDRAIREANYNELARKEKLLLNRLEGLKSKTQQAADALSELEKIRAAKANA